MILSFDYPLMSVCLMKCSLRLCRYPYICCEIFCCEIDEILSILVEDNDGELLGRLLSILNEEECLDNYLAGYFEKMVEMLLKTRTSQMIDYLNYGEIELFKKFVKHVNNHSVMQIVQRLMLPHIPFSVMAIDQDKLDADDKFVPQCTWSFSSETCEILCATLVEDIRTENVASHISDLLITVLQLSPPESVFISNLCSTPCLSKLFPVALADENGSEYCSEVSIAALSVLESLTARLCESLATMDCSGAFDTSVEDQELSKDTTKLSLDNLRDTLKLFLPQVSPVLLTFTRHNTRVTFTAQDQRTYYKVGFKAIQMVKLVESIVRLSDPGLDELICSSEILEDCVKILFEFEMNSLLHLSIQRMICMIIEGGHLRKKIQSHLVGECGLLDQISLFFKDKLVGESMTGTRRGHVPVAGHLVLIVQTIISAVERISPDTSFESCTPACTTDDKLSDAENGNSLNEVVQSTSPNGFRTLLEESEQMLLWTSFLETSYRDYMTPSTSLGTKDDVSFDASFPPLCESTGTEANFIEGTEYLTTPSGEDVGENRSVDDDLIGLIDATKSNGGDNININHFDIVIESSDFTAEKEKQDTSFTSQDFASFADFENAPFSGVTVQSEGTFSSFDSNEWSSNVLPNSVKVDENTSSEQESIFSTSSDVTEILDADGPK